MSITFADRVKETTTTTGTGTVNLGGAASGYQTFVAGAGDGAYVPYCIVLGTEWETGFGYVTDAATDTLSRVTVVASSNAGALVNFSAGTKDVFLTLHSNVAGRALEVIGVYDPSAVATLDIDISGYEMVQITGHLLPATDNVTPWLRVSNDGGATFEAGASYYAWAQQYAYAPTTDGGVADAADSEIEIGASNTGNAAGEGVNVDVTINSPAESGIQTSVVFHSCNISTAGGLTGMHGIGKVIGATEVNDAVRLMFSSGNIASGHIVAYGYKSSSFTIDDESPRAVDVIATFNPTAGDTFDIDISGYDSVQAIGYVKHSADGNSIAARLSNDGGATFESGASYYTRWYHWVNSSGGEFGSGNTASDVMNVTLSTGNAAGEYATFDFRMIAAGASDVKTTLIGSATIMTTAGVRERISVAGHNNTEEVNDALRLLVSSTGTVSGHIIVYGFKNAATSAASHVQVVAVETQEVTAAVAQLDFDISGYESVDLRGWIRPATDTANLRLRMSNDGGSTFRSGASDYGWGVTYDQIDAANPGTSRTDPDTAMQIIGNLGSATNEGANFEIRITMAGESGYSTVSWSTLSVNSTGNFYRTSGRGYVATAEVNDAVRLLFSSGNIAAGKVTMYGYPRANG